VEKLDPQLRILLEQHRAAAPQPRAARSLAPAADEPVDIVIEFRGDVADLEALGFVPDSSITHPTKGCTTATGTIALRNLERVSKIEHVVLPSAPRLIRPLLNDSADKIRALAVHPGNPGGDAADAAIPILPVTSLSRCRRRR